MGHRVALACSLTLAATLTGCPADPPAQPPGASPSSVAAGPAAAGASGERPATGAFAADDPQARELKALFERVVAANRGGDLRQIAGICRELYPQPERIEGVLRPDAPAGLVKAVNSMYAALEPGATDDAAWARLLDVPRERTEVRVYAATTEAIAAKEPGGVVEAEFHPGAVGAAKSVLAPGVTFYEVEVVEPGEDAGTKFHLLFNDGGAWRMLGPVWRVRRARKG